MGAVWGRVNGPSERDGDDETDSVGFDARKAFSLVQRHLIHDVLSNVTKDASPKGTLDSHIEPIVSVINGMRDFYTTSSCRCSIFVAISGRISIMSQPLERTKEIQFWGFPRTDPRMCLGGKWLLVTHDKINYSEAKEALINLSNFSSSTAPTASVVPMGGEDLVVFRFEPMVGGPTRSKSYSLWLSGIGNLVRQKACDGEFTTPM
eukprot:jgi/Bigna1/79101/fgenesh1_pg.59_\